MEKAKDLEWKNNIIGQSNEGLEAKKEVWACGTRNGEKPNLKIMFLLSVFKHLSRFLSSDWNAELLLFQNLNVKSFIKITFMLKKKPKSKVISWSSRQNKYNYCNHYIYPWNNVLHIVDVQEIYSEWMNKQNFTLILK